MERGLAQGICIDLLSPPQLKFLIPGEPTPSNPIKAFQQGLHGEGRSDQSYGIEGVRCTACGYLELYAQQKTT
jgi:hypothetical protein